MSLRSKGEAEEGEAVSEANVGRGKSVPLSGDLALVADKSSHPGDELQVIHQLRLFRLFPIAGADFRILFFPCQLADDSKIDMRQEEDRYIRPRTLESPQRAFSCIPQDNRNADIYRRPS